MTGRRPTTDPDQPEVDYIYCHTCQHLGILLDELKGDPGYSTRAFSTTSIQHGPAFTVSLFKMMGES